MNKNKKYQAKQLLSKLQRLNYTVRISTKGLFLFFIDSPVRELESVSVEVIEQVDGVRKILRAARCFGCTVVWEA